MVPHSHDEMTNEPVQPKVPKKPKEQNRFDKFGAPVHRTRVRGLGIFRTCSDGAVSIEMVFFMLVFVVAFFGAVEMAREISVKHALDVGTYRAARYLSIVPSDPVTARQMIQNELDHNMLGGAGSVQMTVAMPSPSFQTIFSVTAVVAYQPVVPLMRFAPKTLRVTHSQSIEAYP